MEGPHNCAEGQQRDTESTSDGSCACCRALCMALTTHVHPHMLCEQQWDLIILGLLAQSFHLGRTLEGHAEAISRIHSCGP